MTAKSLERINDIVGELALDHGQDLVTLAYLLSGDEGEAEDIVQAVLTRLLGSSSIIGVENPYAYAKRAVTNEFLSKLAEHAPRYDRPHVTPHRQSSRYFVPLLASACVAAVAVTFSSLMWFGDTTEAPVATPSSSLNSSTTGTAAGDSTEVPVRLKAVETWRHERVADCAAWQPAAGDAVVQLDRLDDECISKVPRSSTTVLLVPFTDEGPFGDDWSEVTKPWREVGGHQLDRLASGPLAEMSSRVIDAIVCASCDQIIVVLGPDPSTVRALIESVSA